jgi:hypothetical protein
MSIIGKIKFMDDVEFTTTDINSNKFIIYYRENGELIKYSLPLSLIEDFTYIDEEKIICPICESTDILIPESADSIKPPEMKNEDIVYFDNISDIPNWECLKCGANQVSLAMKEPEVIPNFVPRYFKPKQQEVYDDDTQGSGCLKYLKINGKRYREVLHWFKVPRRLLKVIGKIFTKVMPIFKYYEKDYYIYLEYLWYLDGIQHKQAISNHLIDDCRVCNQRYLKPPKHFNREILKYKYPNMWNLIDAAYKWEIKDNCATLQIKWNKKKYYKNFNGE